MAKLRPLLHELPEFLLVTFRAAGHIHEIDGHRSLIETAIVFMTSIWIQAYRVRSKESPAAHAGIYIALQLPHDLGADAIRYHPFRRALGCQLCQIPIRSILGNVILVQNIDQFWECGGDPHTNFVLNPLEPLFQRLDND